LRFDIDTWPHIPTYLEIEGDSEEKIFEGMKLVGLDQKYSTNANAREIFAKYRIDPKKLRF
jgi:adenylate cyclase class 2